MYIVYIVRCVDDSLYCGITTDIKRRLREHNDPKKAAAYTRSRQPVTLVYTEACESRIDALKREYAIKQLSRRDKLRLVSTSSEKP